MTEYLVGLLGQVAAFGVRADDAARDLVERTSDEFAFAVSRSTGMNITSLAALKHDVMTRVLSGSVRDLTACKGRTKHGAPCKKRVLLEYCDAHRHQGVETASKKRRVDAYIETNAQVKNRRRWTVSPVGRFRFT